MKSRPEAPTLCSESEPELATSSPKSLNSLLLSLHAKMPSSDYSNAVGGGLKLKGSSSGIDKKKKKRKSKPAEESEKKVEVQPDQPAEEDSNEQTALQKALADEEGERGDGKASEADVKEYGKTEAQRRFEERRKKRVSAHIYTYTEGEVWRILTTLNIVG